MLRKQRGRAFFEHIATRKTGQWTGVVCNRANFSSHISYGTKYKPKEVRLKKAERKLEVDFDNGTTFTYPAEYLRVYSPSAEVAGHFPGDERIVAGKKDVAITMLEPVGNYAIQIHFDDLHDTGIYSWEYLYELGVKKFSKMKTYIRKLQAIGRTRDPKQRISWKRFSSATPNKTNPSTTTSPTNNSNVK